MNRTRAMKRKSSHTPTPTTTSRLSDSTAEPLPVELSNETFERQPLPAHIEGHPITPKTCILCTRRALKGRKYCAAHQERANGQTLAEKVAEQRAAKARANRQPDASDVTTILAALRLFQRTYRDCDAAAIARDWPEHFTEGMQSVQPMPLGSEDIDELCEALNCGDLELYAPIMQESLPAPIQSEQQYKDTLAAQNDRQRRNNEAQPESQPSKTWTPPNATAFLEMRGCTVQAPCGCLLEPTESGAALYQCEMHERLSKATFADASLITEARELYQNDDIEIDDTEVRTSRADNGTWVAAWVWVADSDLGPDGKPRGEV